MDWPEGRLIRDHASINATDHSVSTRKLCASDLNFVRPLGLTMVKMRQVGLQQACLGAEIRWYESLSRNLHRQKSGITRGIKLDGDQRIIDHSAILLEL